MSSILENLKNEDESHQLMAALDLAETLLMSQEDLLYTLPLTEIITALISILNKEHNPELMMAAARCFVGILEVSPQMAVRMTSAVPIFISKLSQLEYIDLVEVCLSVLDRLARAHGHQIVTSGCLTTLQTYFDFFSSETQGVIFRIMANCAYFIRTADLRAHVSSEMIGAFGQRMCLVKNKTHLETLCTFFTRVVDNCSRDVEVLRSHFGVKNDFLQCILSTLHHRAVEVGGGASLLRLMEVISRRCRDLAVELIKIDVAETMHLLLCGTEMNAMETSTLKKADLTTQRPSNQICQILRLFCDLLPQLPDVGIFSINDVLLQYSTSSAGATQATQQVASSFGSGTSVRLVLSDNVPIGSTNRYQWFMKRDVDYNMYDDEDDDDSVGQPSSTNENDNSNNDDAESESVVKAQAKTSAVGKEQSDGQSVASSSASVVNNDSANQRPSSASANGSTNAGDEPQPSVSSAENSDNVATSSNVPDANAVPSVLANLTSPPSGYDDWCALSAQDSIMLELSYAEFANHTDDEEMSIQMLGGDEFDLDLSDMACYHYRSNARFLLERRLCAQKEENKSGSNLSKKKKFVDERETLRSAGDTGYTKLLSLFPLFVDIGNASTCVNVRFGVLNALSRALFACSESSERLSALLKDVSLSPFISGTLNSYGKHLGMVVACIQIVRQVMDNLSEIYVPLFESEGVLHEIRKHLEIHEQKLNEMEAEKDKPSSSRGLASFTTSKTSDSTTKNEITSKASNKSNKRKNKKRQPSAQKVEASSSNETVSSSASSTAPSASCGSGTAQQNNNNAVAAKLAESCSRVISMRTLLKSKADQHLKDTKNLKVQALTSFIVEQCKEIIAIVKGYQEKEDQIDQRSYSPNTSFRLLVTIAQRLTTDDEDAGLEPLTELKDLLANSNLGSVTGFQFNQSGIFEALNRYLTEDSTEETDDKNEKKTSVKSSLVPKRAERLFRFINVFTDDFFETCITERSNCDNAVESFKNLVNRVVTTLGQFERFPIRIATSTFVEEDNTMSPSFNIAEQMLRVVQRKQLYCSLRKHETCKSSEHNIHDRISVRPLAPISTLENFILENMHFSTTRATLSLSSPSVSTAVSGSYSNVSESSNASNAAAMQQSDLSTVGAAVAGTSAGSSAAESRKSSTTSFASTVENEDLRVDRSRSSSYAGRVELFFGPHKLPPGISILQAIVQYSIDIEDGGSDVIPESIWSQNHTFHYRAVMDDPQPAAHASADLPSTSSSYATCEDGAKKASLKGDDKSLDDTVDNRLSPPSRKMAKVDISRAALCNSDCMDVDLDESGKSGTAVKSRLERYLDAALAEFAGFKFSDDPSVDCLVLLKSLYGVNTLAWSLQNETKSKFISKAPILPMEDFLVSKLDSKVMRQLTDVLCVVTGRLPKWLKLLVTKMPFIFQFSTRINFLHTTVFGTSRAMRYLLHENKVNRTRFSKSLLCKLVPEVTQRKVIVKRGQLLEEAIKIFNQSDYCGDLLDVQFEGEVGSGHGPTLEFYSSLSRELQRHSLKMWSGQAVAENAEERSNSDYEHYFTTAENGLYPRVWLPSEKMESFEREAQLKNFNFLGRLLAQALIDGRLLDIPFAPSLFKWLVNEESSLSFEDDFSIVEPTFYNSLINLINATNQEFEDMQMYFVYPGSEFEMVNDGSNMMITKANFHTFVKLVTAWRLRDGVQAQMHALRDGFYAIIKVESQMPHIFDVKEIEKIFCGTSDADDPDNPAYAIWATDALRRNFHVDHGYCTESPQVKWLAQMLNGFMKEQRRKFLQFVTGSPRLPIGGFSALSPPLTVVRKYVNDSQELPSAMTCFNYLKLPAYNTYEQLVERFLVALEFTHSFHLS